MKVTAGVVVAGVLAAGAALMAAGDGSGEGALPPAAVSGPPRQEHFAIAAAKIYLDGPKLQAMCMDHKVAAPDADGNIWLLNGYALGSLRVIRADNGMVETVSGDDKWNTDLDLAEGPAAFLPELTTHMRAMARGFSFIGVSGLPLKGEEQGCVYTSCQGYPHRIYRNKEKGGRWWFKRLGNTGKSGLPTETGKTVRIDDVNLSGAVVGGDSILSGGNFYSFDAAKGEITCLLSTSDYIDKLKSAKTGKALGAAQQIFRDGDGSFYLRYYQWVPEGCVFKISPDRTKIEEVMRSRYGTANFDGPGLDAGYWGGPTIFGVRDGVVLVGVIDGNCIRRWKDGRTSTLCRDGEWRELPTSERKVQGWMFKGWQPDFRANAAWVPYPGEESHGDIRFYKVSPINFTKPTAGTSAANGGK